MKERIAVVGGGLAGLTAAYDLARRPDTTVTLFEGSPRLGGVIESRCADGFVIEYGPDSWVAERTEAAELATELGLGETIVYSQDALRRTYIAQGRELVPLPDGMRMMVPTRWQPVLDSPLFSWTARLAYLREPRRAEQLRLLAQSRPEEFDEPVAAFVQRHFGAEAAETIAGPLLAGIFGGDIHKLSAAAALGPFLQMEREHGSIIAPVMASAQAARVAGRERPLFATLRGGLRCLVDALVAHSDADLRMHTPVRAVRPAGAGWRVFPDGAEERFDRLVLATPAHATRALLHPFVPEIAALLPDEESTAIIVALCFDREASARMRVPRGFGFLAPAGRQASQGAAPPQLLAGTFMQSKFPHRAPEGCMFLRGFFGGPSAPSLLAWSDEDLTAAAVAHLGRLLGPLPQPLHTVVQRLPRSLPQYTVGHRTRMRRMAEALPAWPTLGLTGNAYEGVGLSAVVGHARATVRRLMATS